jgi:lycopene cyclase domain-containing protein
MTPYTTYNLALAAFILPGSYWLAGRRNRRRNLTLSARIAVLVTLIAYPWDYFAIHVGVWRYPNAPGLRLHDVPLNDLVFIWLCSHLACSFLIAVHGRESGGQGHSERKNAGQQNAGDDGTRSSGV